MVAKVEFPSEEEEIRQLYPLGFEAYLSAIPDLSEEQLAERKKFLIVIGDFPKSNELKKLIGKLGYLCIFSGEMITDSIFSRQPNRLGQLLAWPRNAFNQFGENIILYNGLLDEYLRLGQERFYFDPSYQTDSIANLRISHHRRLYNGGQIFGSDSIIICPEIYTDDNSLIYLNSLGKEVLLFPLANVADFDEYFSPSELEELEHIDTDGYLRRLGHLYSDWPDLDMFVMPVSSFSGDQLLIDEIYARIYSDKIERTSENHQIHIINSQEAGNCALNLLQLPGKPNPIIIPGPNPETTKLLEEKVVGKGNVFQFPVSWCSDPKRIWALHCRTNQIRVR